MNARESGRSQGMRMFGRALAAFLVMPGVVAFALPAAYLWWRGQPPVYPLGWIPLGIGTVALLWCVRDFYVAGRGTLAPWDPPRHLVTNGLYRWSRNPMYVAVVLILFGWAAAFASLALAVAALSVATAFHVRVVVGEEPWLARTFGPEWYAYRARVRRWF